MIINSSFLDYSSGNNMKVSALIITYNDRLHLISQVINELLRQQVTKIFIIDNNSTERTKEGLWGFKKNNKSKIVIYHLDNNTGTAYAFKLGLQQILNDDESEFIWILDDDNLPCDNALKELKKYWKDCCFDNKEHRLMLSSYRETKIIYKQAVEQNNSQLIIGRNNIFRSFHLFSLHESIRNKFSYKRNVERKTNVQCGEIAAAPYGGSFFNKKVLEEIGFPDEKYYLYSDDYDFSYRITKNGGKIILVLGSRIKDIEPSWNISGFAVYNIVKQKNQVTLYYSIRNRIHFEKSELVNNKIMYTINMVVYSSVVFFLGIILLRFRNLKTYFTAVRNGLCGEFGKNENYLLN